MKKEGENQMGFDQKGIATATVFVVLGALVFGTIGPSILADTVDAQPDGPLYSLELVGESIKKPFLDDRAWYISHAEERLNEFLYVDDRGKADKYSWLAKKPNSYFSKAITLSKNTEELDSALKGFRKYSLKLENIKTGVPSEVGAELKGLQLQSFLKVGEVKNMMEEKKFSEIKVAELEDRLRAIEIETDKLVDKKGSELEFELIGDFEKVSLRTNDTSLAFQIGRVRENRRIEQIENLVLEIEKTSSENHYVEIGPAENISIVWPEDNIRLESGLENVKLKVHRENYRIGQPENIEVTLRLENVRKRRENRRFRDLVVEGDGVQGNVISLEEPGLAPQAEGENVAILSAETKWYASVVIAADEEYRAENPDWRDRTESVLEDADDHFIQEYGLNFRTVRFEEYNSDDSLSDPRELFGDALEKVNKENANLMLAFCGQYSGSIGGLAELRGDDAMIFPESVGWIPNESEVSQHELSHIYNALDHDPGLTDFCIMSYTWIGITRRWCGTCQERMNDYILDRAPLRAWTDEETNPPGENIEVFLKNKSKRTLEVGEVKVGKVFSHLDHPFRGKFWPIYNSKDRIAPDEVYRVELKPKLGPWIIPILSSGGGENLGIKIENTTDLKEIWDQDPPDPGEYWLTWKPYDPERDETFGRASCRFSVTGSLLHVEPPTPQWVKVGENLRFTAQLVTYHENKDFGFGILSTRDVTEDSFWSLSTPGIGRLEKRTVDNGVYEIFQAENVGETILEANYNGHSDNSSVIKASPKTTPPGENIVVGDLDLEAVSDEYLIAELYENENRALKGVRENVDRTGLPPDLPPDPHGVDVIGSVDGTSLPDPISVYYEGSKDIEKGDNLTGYGAYYPEEGYIDAFSDNYWVGKIFEWKIIENFTENVIFEITDENFLENEWVQTDKDWYLPGENVEIYLTNLSDKTLTGDSWRIKGYRHGEWEIVYDPPQIMLLVVGGEPAIQIEPGEALAISWDQTEYIYGRGDDPAEAPQVRSGKYRVVWNPESLKVGKSVGKFTSEFRIEKSKL